MFQPHTIFTSYKYFIMKIYNLIILDQSGSMNSLREEAINGCNATFDTILKSQKEVTDQEHLVTLVTFNTMDINTIFESMPIIQVEPLTRKTYRPTAGTPLYDALGNTLTALSEKLKNEDPTTYSVLVTIITDGLENASTEYTSSAIKTLIEELSDEGWLFSYIGADHDVEESAARLSITNTLEFEKSSSGINKMWETDQLSRMNFYQTLSMTKWDNDAEKRKMQRAELNKEYFEKIKNQNKK